MKLKKYHIYIMASKSRVLYVGITGNLELRVNEHKTAFNPDSFTDRYNCHKLVYFEEFESPLEAIEREKQIKRWRREKKLNLINQTNPEWIDLSEVWL